MYLLANIDVDTAENGSLKVCQKNGKVRKKVRKSLGREHRGARLGERPAAPAAGRGRPEPAAQRGGAAGGPDGEEGPRCQRSPPAADRAAQRDVLMVLVVLMTGWGEGWYCPKNDFSGKISFKKRTSWEIHKLSSRLFI